MKAPPSRFGLHVRLPVLAQMSATRGAILVVGDPLLHVRQVASVRTALTPNVQALHDLVADAAEGVLGRVAAVTEPADTLERFAAFAAIRVYSCRLLVELVY